MQSKRERQLSSRSRNGHSHHHSRNNKSRKSHSHRHRSRRSRRHQRSSRFSTGNDTSSDSDSDNESDEDEDDDDSSTPTTTSQSHNNSEENDSDGNYHPNTRSHSRSNTNPRRSKSKRERKTTKGRCSGYNIYFGQRCKEIQKADPNLEFAIISRNIGNEWKNLNKKDQKKWNDMAQEINDRKAAAQNQKDQKMKQLRPAYLVYIMLICYDPFTVTITEAMYVMQQWMIREAQMLTVSELVMTRMTGQTIGCSSIVRPSFFLSLSNHSVTVSVINKYMDRNMIYVLYGLVLMLPSFY